jgi:type IV secretion system protein VirB9
MLGFAQVTSASAQTATVVPVTTPSDMDPVTGAPGPSGSIRYPFGHVEPTLVCRPLFVCEVILEEGETVLNLAIGDSTRWVVATGQTGPAGSTPLVFVKPTVVGLQTNLVVTTTRRTYFLNLSSSANSTSSRISFSYPDEAAARQAAREAQADADAKERALDQASQLPLLPASQLDYNYAISGEKTIMPQKVFNDGVHTYIEFATLPNDLPIVIAIAQDGSEQVVNFRLLDKTFVVDSIHSGYDLAINAGTGRKGRGERRVYIRHK